MPRTAPDRTDLHWTAPLRAPTGCLSGRWGTIVRVYGGAALSILADGGSFPSGQGRLVQHLDPGGARKAMFTRLLSRWPAGGGALLLVVALSGVVAAATVVTA